MNRIRGFTLIELVTVLVMIAVLSATGGAVTWRHFASQKLDRAARKMVNDFRYAQQYSISTGRWSKVDFHSGNGNDYDINWITQGSATENTVADPLMAGQNYDVDFDESVFKFGGVTFPTPPSTTCTAGATTDEDLVFSTQGVPLCCADPSNSPCPRMSAAYSITLSYAGRTKVVTVEVETGSVRIQ